MATHPDPEREVTLSLEQFIDIQRRDRDKNNRECRESYKSLIRDRVVQWAQDSSGSSGDPSTRDVLESGSTAGKNGKQWNSTLAWKSAGRKVSKCVRVISALRVLEGLDEGGLDDLLEGQGQLECATGVGAAASSQQAAVTRDSSITNVDELLCGTIYNVIQEYQGLLEEAFLLLNAPGPDDPKLAYEHERDARELHLDDFYKVVVGAKDKDKFPVWNIVVHQYREIEEALATFLQGVARSAKRATIVYNGHGSSDGRLRLRDDPRGPKNSEFVSDIYKYWDQCKKRHGDERAATTTSNDSGQSAIMNTTGTTSNHGNNNTSNSREVFLPTKVTVVLAHCYGFVFNQRPNERRYIDVVSLSSPASPKTQFDFNLSPDASDRYVECTVHVELSRYAREVSEEEGADGQVTSSGEPDSTLSIADASGCHGDSVSVSTGGATSRPLEGAASPPVSPSVSSDLFANERLFVPSLIFALALPPETIQETQRSPTADAGVMANSTDAMTTRHVFSRGRKLFASQRQKPKKKGKHTTPAVTTTTSTATPSSSSSTTTHRSSKSTSGATSALAQMTLTGVGLAPFVVPEGTESVPASKFSPNDHDNTKVGSKKSGKHSTFMFPWSKR